MFTYEILDSENPVTFDDGLTSIRIEITNTDTNETKVCDDFTWLDDDSQSELGWLFNNNFGGDQN